MAKARKKKKGNLLPWLALGAIAVYGIARNKASAQDSGAGSSGTSSAGAGSSGPYPDYRGTSGGTWAIINNNPQNILRTGINWRGEVAGNTTPYEMFENMYYGWRAAIQNANANVPLTDRTVEGLLRRLHVGSGAYGVDAQKANAWIISEMRNGGADVSALLPTISEAGQNYDVNYWWLFHRNNARLEAGTKFTGLIDASKQAFVDAFNDVKNGL